METIASQNVQLVHGLIELFESQLVTDVTLIAGDFELSCHRAVLAACSPYFRAMFVSKLQEALEGKARLWDVDPTILQAVIEYMYRGTIKLTQTNVQAVFTTASLFEMIGLQSHCAVFMMSELDVENCIDMYQFASFHSCAALKASSKAYVVGNFAELARRDSLMLLGFSDYIELIADDDLNVSGEEEVYVAITRWIETDIDGRLMYLPKLFNHLRPALMSSEFVDEEICTNELVMSDESCRAMITEVQTYHISRASDLEADDRELSTDVENLKGEGVNITPRLGMFNRSMLVFVGGHDKNSRALTCYDPELKKNYYAIPLHVSFDFKYRIDYHRATVTENNELFIIGGIFYEDHHFEQAGPALTEVRHFDPIKKSWTLCAPLDSPRCAHAVVSHGQNIYAIGGKSTFPEGEPLSSVERYSVYDDEWCYVSSMPKRLYHHCAVVHKDKILVIGGATLSGEITKTFFEYNTKTDTWTVIDNTMAVPRAEFGCAVLKNKLYVIAGTSEQFKVSSVEVFDLETKRWRFCPDFYEDRKSMAAVSFNGFVYVCGGVRTLISRATGQPRVVETKDLWKFDPESEKWTKEAKLVQFANIHACLVAVMNTKCLLESEFVSGV